MKKILFGISLFFIAGSSVWGQDITTVFSAIPNSVIFGLDADEKDKLLDKTDTSKLVVESSVYSGIERKAMTDDYISLQTSSSSNIQIKLLPLINDSKIVCVVRTVCGKACDSQVKFYTTSWAGIDNMGLMPLVSINDFISSNADKDSEAFKNAYAALDMNPVKIILSETENTATIESDIKSYLSKDDYEKIEPFLTKEPKILTWNKNEFK